jgi:hypothetical protein
LSEGICARDEVHTSAIFQLVTSAARRLLAGLLQWEQTERIVKACTTKFKKTSYNSTLLSREPAVEMGK